MFVRPEWHCIASGSIDAIRLTDRRDAKLRDKSLPEFSSDSLFRRQPLSAPAVVLGQLRVGCGDGLDLIRNSGQVLSRNRHAKLVFP